MFIYSLINVTAFHHIHSFNKKKKIIIYMCKTIVCGANILLAELTAIHQGLKLVMDLNVNEIMCYSDSLLAVNLIANDTPRYHIYAALIQNIKDLLNDRNISLHHTLREGNQCADFFAKFGANSDAALVVHQSPPADLLPLLRADALGIYFVRN